MSNRQNSTLFKKQESEEFCGRQITKVPNSHLQAEGTIAQKKAKRTSSV